MCPVWKQSSVKPWHRCCQRDVGQTGDFADSFFFALVLFLGKPFQKDLIWSLYSFVLLVRICISVHEIGETARLQVCVPTVIKCCQGANVDVTSPLIQSNVNAMLGLRLLLLELKPQFVFLFVIYRMLFFFQCVCDHFSLSPLASFPWDRRSLVTMHFDKFPGGYKNKESSLIFFFFFSGKRKEGVSETISEGSQPLPRGAHNSNRNFVWYRIAVPDFRREIWFRLCMREWAVKTISCWNLGLAQ